MAKRLGVGLMVGLGLIALLAWMGPSTAQAGTIILEGSDAIGCHTTGCASDGGGGAEIYRDQVWKAIGGADPRPIAVISHVTGIISTTHPIVNFTSVAAAGALSGYSALYFGTLPGTEDDTLITAPGAAAAVSAYLTAGGTVMIEDYIGGAAWDFAVGAGGAGNAHVGGFAGGFPTGATCDDGESVTTAGTTNGFTQPPPISCWTHQGYQESFFGPLGFTLSFFDSPASYSTGGPWSSLLSSGRTLSAPPAVPEPSTLMLLGAALSGLAVRAWRKRSK